MITNKNVLSDTIIQDNLNDTFLSNILNPNSHWDKHVIANKTDVLNRILSDEISTNSTFTTDINVTDILYDAIAFNVSTIHAWLENPSEHTLIIQRTLDQQLGIGYRINRHTNIISEYVTNTVAVVLRYTPNSKYGFTAITLYPSILPNTLDCTPTCRNLTGLIQKTETYKNASTMKRAYLLYQAIPNKNKPDVHFYTGRYDNDEALMLNIHNKPNVKTIIRITENDLSMWTQHDDKTRIKTTMTQKQQELTGRDSVYVNLNNPDMKAYFDEHMSRASKQIEQLQKLIKRAKPQSQYKQPPNVSFLPADKQHDDEYEP